MCARDISSYRRPSRYSFFGSGTCKCSLMELEKQQCGVTEWAPAVVTAGPGSTVTRSWTLAKPSGPVLTCRLHGRAPMTVAGGACQLGRTCPPLPGAPLRAIPLKEVAACGESLSAACACGCTCPLVSTEQVLPRGYVTFNSSDESPLGERGLCYRDVTSPINDRDVESSSSSSRGTRAPPHLPSGACGCDAPSVRRRGGGGLEKVLAHRSRVRERCGGRRGGVLAQARGSQSRPRVEPLAVSLGKRRSLFAECPVCPAHF